MIASGLSDDDETEVLSSEIVEEDINVGETPRNSTSFDPAEGKINSTDVYDIKKNSHSKLMETPKISNILNKNEDKKSREEYAQATKTSFETMDSGNFEGNASDESLTNCELTSMFEGQLGDKDQLNIEIGASNCGDENKRENNKFSDSFDVDKQNAAICNFPSSTILDTQTSQGREKNQLNDQNKTCEICDDCILSGSCSKHIAQCPSTSHREGSSSTTMRISKCANSPAISPLIVEHRLNDVIEARNDSISMELNSKDVTQTLSSSSMVVPSTPPRPLMKPQIVKHTPRFNSYNHHFVSMASTNNSFLPPIEPGYLFTIPTQECSANGKKKKSYVSNVPAMAQTLTSTGRRRIRLRLVEEVFEEKSSFFRNSLLSRSKSQVCDDHNEAFINSTDVTHGTIVVSWYEGTTTAELQRHVQKTVSRELNKTVDDIRLMDEDVIPHEEVVLTPFIPDGSKFMVKFTVRPTTPTRTIYQYGSKAPDSPSRAPTPHTSDIELPFPKVENRSSASTARQRRKRSKVTKQKELKCSSVAQPSSNDDNEDEVVDSKQKRKGRQRKRKLEDTSEKNKVEKIIYKAATQSEETRHVVFILANYFVLFLSIIAISAELHDRGPRWMKWIEENVDRVNECAVDRDSLFECITNGDVSGLLASIILWIAKNNSVTTRFFLFGFDSVQKLWTVVYEALVTAFCWGTSYLFIRRGMNPDTRENFIRKYWKDAIYGSLAGFNAGFLKAVLKNLIPKEVIEEVLDNNKQLKIINMFRHVFVKN